MTNKRAPKATTTVRSAVSYLSPKLILESGLEVSEKELQSNLTRMSILITDHAKQVWTNNSTIIEQEVQKLGTKKIPFKQVFLRKTCNIDTKIPLQKRILIGNMREIAEHKILTESEAWIRNPNPYKQLFNFNNNIDLSTTGDQLSTRLYSKTTNTVLVKLRCMEYTYLITFQLPKYLQNRSITKISKPRIRETTHGQFTFDFTIEEEVQAKTGKLKAGVDLGSIEPYSAVVITADDRLVAQYYASPGLRALWAKYYRLSEVASFIYKKIVKYEARGQDVTLLRLERSRVVAKRTRLHAENSKKQAYELAKKLGAHNIAVVRVEDLRFVKKSQKGVKQKGGLWNFARQQSDLEHTLARKGSKQISVDARDSSQKCWRCSEYIQHKSERTVWCSECKVALDRDFNAAMNVATENHLRKFERLVSSCGVNEVSCELLSSQTDSSLGVEIQSSCAISATF